MGMAIVLKTVKEFCIVSKVCVRMAGEHGVWFTFFVHVRLLYNTTGLTGTEGRQAATTIIDDRSF